MSRAFCFGAILALIRQLHFFVTKLCFVLVRVRVRIKISFQSARTFDSYELVQIFTGNEVHNQ